MSSSKLPLLPLVHPLVLLPASRISLPVPTKVGEALLSLIDNSDSLPIVAAVPTSSTNQLAEWATAARVLRLVKPPARNPRQPYLVSLHGLTRVQLKSPLPVLDASSILLTHDITYPPTENLPTREVVDKFKTAALRLLDRLARDSVQQARKDGYHKIAGMLEDITDARAAWMADVLAGTVGGEYEDRLGKLQSCLVMFQTTRDSGHCVGQACARRELALQFDKAAELVALLAFVR